MNCKHSLKWRNTLILILIILISPIAFSIKSVTPTKSLDGGKVNKSSGPETGVVSIPPSSSTSSGIGEGKANKTGGADAGGLSIPPSGPTPSGGGSGVHYKDPATGEIGESEVDQLTAAEKLEKERNNFLGNLGSGSNGGSASGSGSGSTSGGGSGKGLNFRTENAPTWNKDDTARNYQTARRGFTLTPVPGDLSVQFLGNIFGLVDGVLHGTGSQIMGKLFSVFNSAILALGGIIITYTIIVGTLNTAHEGEMLGKKWSSIWIPLRSTIGLALLLPKSSGYCLMQIFVMWVIVQGIGAADMLWGTTVDYLSQGGVIIQSQMAPPISLNDDNKNIANGAMTILTGQICMLGLEKILNQVRKNAVDAKSNNIGPCAQANMRQDTTSDIANFCNNAVPDFLSTINTATLTPCSNTPNASSGSYCVDMPNFNENQAPYFGLNGICGTIAFNGGDGLDQGRAIAVQQLFNDLSAIATIMVNNAPIFNSNTNCPIDTASPRGYPGTTSTDCFSPVAIYQFGIAKSISSNQFGWASDNLSPTAPLFSGSEFQLAIQDYQSTMASALLVKSNQAPAGKAIEWGTTTSSGKVVKLHQNEFPEILPKAKWEDWFVLHHGVYNFSPLVGKIGISACDPTGTFGRQCNYDNSDPTGVSEYIEDVEDIVDTLGDINTALDNIMSSKSITYEDGPTKVTSGGFNLKTPSPEDVAKDLANIQTTQAIGKASGAAQRALNASTSSGWLLAGAYFFDLATINARGMSPLLNPTDSNSGLTASIPMGSNLASSISEMKCASNGSSREQVKSLNLCHLFATSVDYGVLKCYSGNCNPEEYRLSYKLPLDGIQTIHDLVKGNIASRPVFNNILQQSNSPIVGVNSSTVWGFSQNQMLYTLPNAKAEFGVTPYRIQMSPPTFTMPYLRFPCGLKIDRICVGEKLGDMFYNHLIVPVINAFLVAFSSILQTVILSVLEIPVMIIQAYFLAGLQSITQDPYVNPIVALANMGTGFINQSMQLWMLMLQISITTAMIPLIGFIIYGFIMLAMPLLINWMGIMLGVGFMTAFYVPFVPYITFTFASIGWFVSVIEAMAAAPIVALGVANPEGQDVLGQAQHGLMILLNVFLRPALMIMGYIAGIAMVYVSVWIINSGFNHVIEFIGLGGSACSGNNCWSSSSAKDLFMGTSALNTTTGYVNWAGMYSFFFGILLYISLYVTVAQKSFDLIYQLPDKVLRWIGGGEQSGSEAAQWRQEVSQEMKKGDQAGTKTAEAQQAQMAATANELTSKLKPQKGGGLTGSGQK